MPIITKKLKNKQTVYTAKINYTEPGTNQYKSVQKTFDFKKDAEIFESEIRIAINTGKFFEPNFNDEVDYNEVTFTQLWEKFYASKKGIKATTEIKYERAFAMYFEPEFGITPVKNIRRIHIVNWREKMYNKHNLSVKTVNNFLVLLNEVFNFGLSNLGLQHNPLQGFKKDKYKRPIQEQYTLDEFEQFISVVDDPMYNLLFKMLYFTGLRKGELLALTFDDMLRIPYQLEVKKSRTYENKEKGTYSITAPKSAGSHRMIVIEKNTYEQFLDFYKQEAEKDGFSKDWYIFNGPTIIGNETLRRRNAKYAKLAKLKKIRIHDFRGSNASFLTSVNGIAIAQKQLGHESIEMTNKYYVNVTDESQKQALDKVSEVVLANTTIFKKR